MVTCKTHVKADQTVKNEEILFRRKSGHDPRRL